MININTSYGELIDKISILKVKYNNINDETKKEQISFELKHLEDKNTFVSKIVFNEFVEELYKVNKDLWVYEDEIRKAIKDNNENNILKYSILICRINDLRFEIKNKINFLLKSGIKEVKQHIKY